MLRNLMLLLIVVYPLREWTSQQKAEKERLAMEEREANRLYELKACEMDQRAVQLAIAEEEARKAVNMAQKDYNLALVCVGVGRV